MSGLFCGCAKVETTCKQEPAYKVCYDDTGRDVNMIGFDVFMPKMRLSAKGASDSIIVEYLRDSCTRFANATNILTRVISVDLQRGVRDYYLEHGDDEQIKHIGHFSLGRCNDMCSFNERLILDNYSSRCGSIGACSMDGVKFEPMNKFIMLKEPKADKESALRVRYVATVSPNACKIDEILYLRYSDAIIAGALAELQDVDGYDFSNNQSAKKNALKFSRGVERAAQDLLMRFNNNHILTSTRRV